MFFKSSIRAIGVAILVFPYANLLAQANEIETAKPADAVSPYGVSYTTGSFTYSLPLFEIGNGVWPERLSVVLHYDSLGNRQPNQSWTLNAGARLSQTTAVQGFDHMGDPDETRDVYNVSIVVGNSSVVFEKQSADPTLGNYVIITNNGNLLDFEPAPGSPPYHQQSAQQGDFIFTSRYGNVFRQYRSWWTGVTPGSYSSEFTGEHTLANGNYGRWVQLASGARMFETNRGIALVIESIVIGSGIRKICAYNISLIDRNALQDCSQSQMVATLNYGIYSIHGHDQILSAQLPDGGTYIFNYVRIYDLAGPNQYEDTLFNPKPRYHLSCIREPEQSLCSIQNEYDACDGPGAGAEDTGWTGSRDRVVRQTLGDGRVITYSYLPTSLPCRYIGSVTMNDAGASTVMSIGFDNQDHDYSNVISALDPLNRPTQYQWGGRNPQAAWLYRNGNLGSITFPAGNSLSYQYDDRGNVIEARRTAAPGSGLENIVQSAVFPTMCTNPRTCNRPLSTADARGHITEYEYDPTHGGLLSETGPPDANGVRPRKRYYYQQRYAWLRSGSSYVQAATPVRVLASERFCRTSATIGDGCAGGAQDEVVTTYEYGPNAGPNNLWLRGMTVASEGATLRTCYGYDAFGRRISETSPGAGLTTCP